MSEQLLQIEVNNAVAVISLNRPKSRNALTRKMLEELNQQLTGFDSDESVRVIVITGNGQGFCSGADLAEAGSNYCEKIRNTEDLLEKIYKPVFSTIASMEKPVISAVQGTAAGAGASLALICDLCVMSEDAKLMFAFNKVSLVPDCGATWLLLKQIGYKRSYQLLAEAEAISAQRCVELGLCNQLVAADELLNKTRSWAEKLSQLAPISLGLTKRLLRQADQQSLSECMSAEARLQEQCAQSEDFKEAQVAFFEKRKPEFKGR